MRQGGSRAHEGPRRRHASCVREYARTILGGAYEGTPWMPHQRSVNAGPVVRETGAEGAPAIA